MGPPEIVFKKSSKYSRRLSKYSRTYDEGTVENSSSYSRASQKTVEKNASRFFREFFPHQKSCSRKVRVTFVNFRLFPKLKTNLIFSAFFRLFFDWAGCNSNYFRLYLRHKFENISKADGCISYFFRP